MIRLPINLHAMTGGAPDYTLDPLFLYFLDQAVDWAEELEIHLLLDNHTFDPALNTDPDIGDILVPVWTQMALHFKDRSNLVYYEILNEPHGISDASWNAIQKRVIEAIRLVDQKHTLVIGPAGWNSYNNLAAMPPYEDGNLIYTFHFYDPFLFTHQGASWTDPPMTPLAGVPFPYEAARMPACPAALKGTWIEGSLNNSYKTDGTVARVKSLIDIAARFATTRNVKLFCGEFGVYIPNSPAEDRVFWYDAVQDYLEEKEIAWTIWDYTGGFGLFEPGTGELFDYDLNVPLLEALDLNVPEQKTFESRPDSAGFTLYDDYIGPGIFQSSYSDGSIIDFYSETGPALGRTCIHWADAPQYRNIGFAFKPRRDLSLLADEGYAIDFWVRGDTPDSRFDIRFIDTKTEDPDDHPWRMRMTIDENLASWDDSWYHLQIPLEDFTEHGSWDNNAWFNPQGLFDWAAVDRFEIVAEHQDFGGNQFWFDQIRVVDPAVVGIGEIASRIPESTGPGRNYPNPFNPETIIPYRLDRPSRIEMFIYNAAGRKVRTLLDEEASAGNHTALWDGTSDSGDAMPSGVYFCRMAVQGLTRMRKMLLLR
ncbi:cellulase family glycosylhydrolase [bacterium]|nr:cellulase family glycosylhydrolase [bacterium]